MTVTPLNEPPQPPTSMACTEFHCQFVAGVVFWTTHSGGAAVCALMRYAA